MAVAGGENDFTRVEMKRRGPDKVADIPAA